MRKLTHRAKELSKVTQPVRVEHGNSVHMSDAKDHILSTDHRSSDLLLIFMIFVISAIPYVTIYFSFNQLIFYLNVYFKNELIITVIENQWHCSLSSNSLQTSVSLTSNRRQPFAMGWWRTPSLAWPECSRSSPSYWPACHTALHVMDRPAPNRWIPSFSMIMWPYQTHGNLLNLCWLPHLGIRIPTLREHCKS